MRARYGHIEGTVRAVPTLPTIGGTGTLRGPYIYRTGCTRENVRAPHCTHTVPRTDPVPFCPYRPRTVFPVLAPYRFAPVLSLQAITNPYRPGIAAVPFCPYRPRTVLSPCCPYKPLLMFLSSLLLFCLDEFPFQQFVPKVQIRDGVNGSFMCILRKS